MYLLVHFTGPLTSPYIYYILLAIEETPGRLKIIEILANFFRSVMVLSPDDFIFSVYMCLNRLAPAYEGTLPRGYLLSCEIMVANITKTLRKG